MDQDTDRFIRATRGNANPLDDVEQKLRNTIFGQERAIEAVVRVLNRARFGFSAGNPRRPRATLLFLGPTGVGKTATARRLAQLLRLRGNLRRRRLPWICRAAARVCACCPPSIASGSPMRRGSS